MPVAGSRWTAIGAPESTITFGDVITLSYSESERDAQFMIIRYTSLYVCYGGTGRVGEFPGSRVAESSFFAVVRRVMSAPRNLSS